MKKVSRLVGVVLGLSCLSSFFVEIASATPHARPKAAPKKSAPRRNTPRSALLSPQAIHHLNQQLSDLRSRRDLALKEYTPTSSQVRNLNNQIMRLQSLLRQNRTPRVLSSATEPRFQLLSH
ncbi:hypothetical protein B1R32_11095 [Abditibacterium utsteinense]|uniref:Uncharacterized protein n=2 Tax=Abditibacterium utsteinense TaxID=1960156 RepID=A0A2S8SSB4_9BACT|nr:hypothetical protein B1R32_11095 [Abditibacterium utsteinense]